MSISDQATGNEIKVWGTVGHGLKFAVTSYIPMVLKVSVWLVLGIAVMSWMLYSAPAFTQEDVDTASPAFWANIRHSLFYSLPQILIGLPIYVAGILYYFKHPDGKGIYLRFGGREWRLIGASIIVSILILLILSFVTAVYCGAIWAILTYVVDTGVTLEQLQAYAESNGEGGELDPTFLAIIFLGGICWLISFVWASIWASMRFILIDFDVVTTNKIRIGHAWSITSNMAGKLFLLTLVFTFLFAIIGFGIGLTVSIFIQSDAQEYIVYLILGQPADVLSTPNLEAAVIAATFAQFFYLFLYQWSIGVYGRVYKVLCPEQTD